MECEPKNIYQQPKEPDSEQLKSFALQRLREAVELVEAYRMVGKNEFGMKYDDFEDQIRDEILLPMLLGAPGEQCQTCGGSGRKK